MAAELLSFQVASLPALTVVGKSLRVQMEESGENPIPAFWDRCFGDGTLATLMALPDRPYPDVLVGWVGRWNPDDQSFIYLVGVLCNPDAETPEGMSSEDLPGTSYAVCTIGGPAPDIFEAAEGFMTRECDAHEFARHEELEYAIEWYDDRFEGERPTHHRLFGAGHRSRMNAARGRFISSHSSSSLNYATI
jgi:predicted transcriptional regulator YdeE